MTVEVRMNSASIIHISGKYLLAHACEMAWKEDSRRIANGGQHEAVAGMALAHPVSRAWADYCQRRD